jgi:diguanylate cyclase (GGDEF)-like protein
MKQKVIADDLGDSPYARQWLRGFAWLRFTQPLEREFRAYLARDTLQLKRITCGVAVFGWLLFALFDQFLLSGPPSYWVLLIRLLVLAILIYSLKLLLGSGQGFAHQRVSIAFALALGVAALLILAVAHAVDASYPYEGLLLIIIAVYFMLGLRLVEALLLGLSIMLAYAGLVCWMNGDSLHLMSNLAFIMLVNLIGAIGCYNLEFKAREHFLLEHLLGVLADRDSLTGLHNRRSFNRLSERLVRQAERESMPLALLLCDVDHFKAYNDHYGHQAGDRALHAIGELLQSAARRPLDLAVRLGGEEFAVLLYGDDSQQAREHAERLRQALLDLRLPHAGSSTSAVLSISIGVAVRHADANLSISRLMSLADRALYQAKSQGRNRVVLS